MDIKNIIKNSDFKGVQNKTIHVGKLVGIDSKGIHSGIEQIIAIMETERIGSKKQYIFVVLPKCKETNRLIRGNKKIFIEGILTSSYTFNNTETKHVFVVPSKIKELEEDFKMEELEEFYMNYTIYNRVILEGIIHTEPTNKSIDKSTSKVNKFKLRFTGEGNRSQTINCTLWDTVNDLPKIEKDLNVRVVGSFNITNESIINRVNGMNPEDTKGIKYTSYNLLIQNIQDLDSSAEKLARRIYI